MKYRSYKSPAHAKRAGRRHAKAKKPMVQGDLAWPGHYVDGYRSVNP
jgi:hypothetical protein